MTFVARLDDGQLSDSHRNAFGLSAEAEAELRLSIRQKMGTVLGADGYGGSGIFVEVPDGSTALLTARHVVVGVLVTGELTVGSLAGKSSGTQQPLAIRCAARADVAYLKMPPAFVHDRLPLAAWTVEGDLRVGDCVVSSGIVAEWTTPDAARRIIPVNPVLHFWTSVLRTGSESEHVVLDINEADLRMPKSVGGMSGGPVFDLHGRFVGINVLEERRIRSDDGRLRILPARSLPAVYAPVKISDPPTDYMGQEVLPFTHSRTYGPRGDQTAVPIRMTAQFLWSPSNPDHRYGSWGRITSLTLAHTEKSAAYPINLESDFLVTSDDRISALEQEIGFLLKRFGFKEPT